MFYIIRIFPFNYDDNHLNHFRLLRAIIFLQQIIVVINYHICVKKAQSVNNKINKSTLELATQITQSSNCEIII